MSCNEPVVADRLTTNTKIAEDCNGQDVLAGNAIVTCANLRDSLNGLVLGTDCDGNQLTVGAILATCQNLNETRQEILNVIENLVLGKTCQGADIKIGEHNLVLCEDLENLVIGVDCDGNEVNIGDTIATCDNINDLRTEILNEVNNILQTLVIGKDCDGNDITIGSELATCQNLSDKEAEITNAYTQYITQIIQNLILGEDCEGNEIPIGASLATCKDLQDGLASIMDNYVESVTSNVVDKTVTITFKLKDGTQTTTSFELPEAIDKFVTNIEKTGTVEAPALLVTWNDSQTQTVALDRPIVPYALRFNNIVDNKLSIRLDSGTQQDDGSYQRYNRLTAEIDLSDIVTTDKHVVRTTPVFDEDNRTIQILAEYNDGTFAQADIVELPPASEDVFITDQRLVITEDSFTDPDTGDVIEYDNYELITVRSDGVEFSSSFNPIVSAIQSSIPDDIHLTNVTMGDDLTMRFTMSNGAQYTLNMSEYICNCPAKLTEDVPCVANRFIEIETPLAGQVPADIVYVVGNQEDYVQDGQNLDIELTVLGAPAAWEKVMGDDGQTYLRPLYRVCDVDPTATAEAGALYSTGMPDIQDETYTRTTRYLG